jgi:tetratricopeptide (TPR) repeat protein
MTGLGRDFACWASRDDEGDDEGDDELDELNQAITMLGDAISLTSGHDPRLPSRLTDLATYLTLRFISSSDLKDIDEAITAGRDAVNLIPDDNPDLAISLTVLAKALYKRYIKTSVDRDLNDAHTRVIMATEITPEDLPELADMWILRGKIESLYEAQREGEDSSGSGSADAYLAAFCCKSARPLDRIRAVRKAIEDQWQWRTYRNSREVAEAAVELLSTVCSRYATRHEQLTAVRNTSGFAADVCSILLEESESHSIDSKPEQALECLEQGRCLIIGYVTEGRTEISNLRQKYRRKAQELEQLQHAASLRFHTTMDVLSQQRLLFERDEAASKIEPFLAGIQSLPGYERFPLPPSLQTLKDTASEGPIVIVNVTDISSAALIVRPSP